MSLSVENTGGRNNRSAGDIQNELVDLRRRIAELERNKQALEQQVQSGSANEIQTPVATQEELAMTLQTFVRRVAMILQGEKCVIMLYDHDSGELVAQHPALKFTDDEINAFRVRANEGVSGEAFREGHAIICHDCSTDTRTLKDKVAILNVRDSLTVPMIIERRNENQQVVERTIIGVIHVFNKRYGMKFTEEDIRLLTVLARNAAAVISSAKIIINIAQEKKQLEYTLQSMSSGLLVITRGERIQIVNTAAETILGLDSGSTGIHINEAIGNAELREFLSHALKTESEIAKEFVINDLYYATQTAIVRDDKKNTVGLLCILNDVTDLRNVERMKSDFVSTVSHELRTPLTAIKGFIRTLLDDPEEDFYDRPTRREFYEIIDSECDRLVRLISDLLNVSRIERGLPLHLNYDTVSLPELIEKCVSFQRSYTDKHTLIAKYPEKLATIYADKDKMDQILTNLISNAIKYSPEGGDIITEVVDEGDNMRFAVIDQGMGIPREHIDKVFQRFHRVHSGDSQRVGGTGIGLFLVKNLVQAHGGAIWVDSVLGKGSTFFFTIPKKPPEQSLPSM